MNWFLDTIPIEPSGSARCACRSIRQDGPRHPTWPLYPIPPEKTYVNVGFWSVVPIKPGAPEGATNRLIEDKVSELGGHKSLYSDAFYSRGGFRGAVRRRTSTTRSSQRYDPDSRLLNLYEKAVRRQ